jgi:hypothetical protein
MERTRSTDADARDEQLVRQPEEGQPPGDRSHATLALPAAELQITVEPVQKRALVGAAPAGAALVRWTAQRAGGPRPILAEEGKDESKTGRPVYLVLGSRDHHLGHIPPGGQAWPLGALSRPPRTLADFEFDTTR